MCEIGSVVAARGEVKQVKVLGTLALIDEGMDHFIHWPLSQSPVELFFAYCMEGLVHNVT